MTNRNHEILKYLESIYIPKDRVDDLRNLRERLKEYDYREIQYIDSGKSYPLCLVIKTKGKGQYSAFAGYEITRIDVGSVSRKFAELAIYHVGCCFAYPKRVAKSNIKVSIQK